MNRHYRNGKYSIISKLDHCEICGTTLNLHTHEVFYGSANRRKSINDGMVVTLCAKHHNTSKSGVHFHKELDQSLKVKGQLVWEENYGTREMFIRRYGRSYIDAD